MSGFNLDSFLYVFERGNCPQKDIVDEAPNEPDVVFLFRGPVGVVVRPLQVLVAVLSQAPVWRLDVLQRPCSKS